MKRNNYILICLFAFIVNIFSLTLTQSLYAYEAVKKDGEAQSLDIDSLLDKGEIPPNVGLDQNGYPIQGGNRGLTPAQKNPLLGRPVLMTAMECQGKYGAAFCACSKLDTGDQACYYRTPSAGYYDIKACEAVWGSGGCECDNEGLCKKRSAEREADMMSCLDQVVFFPGETMECRQAGVMSGGKNCCMKNSSTDKACSFENLAKKIGMSEIIMTAASISMQINDLAGLTGTSFTDMAAKKIATSVINDYVKNGAVGVLGDLTSLFGDKLAEQAINDLTAKIGEKALDELGQEALKQATQEATTAMAGMLAGAINIAGWVYTAYKVYNMVQDMRQCSAGEFMLGCKIAKATCHRVGTRCKTKVLGVCLQKMTAYCCFNSQMARIIHEQGRGQIGMGWGSAKKPMCRGFFPNEFMKLNFAEMDFSEYAEEIARQMSKSSDGDINKAVERAMENFGL